MLWARDCGEGRLSLLTFIPGRLPLSLLDSQAFDGGGMYEWVDNIRYLCSYEMENIGTHIRKWLTVIGCIYMYEEVLQWERCAKAVTVVKFLYFFVTSKQPNHHNIPNNNCIELLSHSLNSHSLNNRHWYRVDRVFHGKISCPSFPSDRCCIYWRHVVA